MLTETNEADGHVNEPSQVCVLCWSDLHTAKRRLGKIPPIELTFFHVWVSPSLDAKAFE